MPNTGVISLESPAFAVSAGQRKKVVVKFWLRGSVVYPAALRYLLASVVSLSNMRGKIHILR